MDRGILLDEIEIRNELRPGDIGYIVYMHGSLYKREYDYGIEFERYVAKGLCEFVDNYDPGSGRIWICEHKGKMVGSLLLMNRGSAAQLRYFLIDPEYRGVGLGSKLIGLFVNCLKEMGYRESYLWTTHELSAAAFLYKRAGFKLTEEKESTAFGKPLREQKYVLLLK